MTRKRKTVIFIMAAIMLLVGSTAYAGCFINGNELMKLSDEQSKGVKSGGFFNAQSAVRAGEFAGYCMGVVDATIDQYDIPSGVGQVQIESIISRYLKAHPEEWHLCGADLVIKAIKQAYPKRK